MNRPLHTPPVNRPLSMKRATLPLLSAALLLGACGQSGTPASTASGTTTGSSDTTAGSGVFSVATTPALPVSGSYQDGQLLVGYSSDDALNAAAARIGASVTTRVPTLHAALLKLGGLSVGQALYALQGQAGVAFAQPNYLRSLPKHTSTVGSDAVTGSKLSAQLVPSDPKLAPYFQQQYALQNDPPEGMNVAAAWDALRAQGAVPGSSAKGGKPVVLAYFAEPLPTVNDFAGQTVAGLDYNAWAACVYPNTAPSAKKYDPNSAYLSGSSCNTPSILTTGDIQNIQANMQPGVNYTTAANSGGEASLDATNMIANGAGTIGVAYGAKLMPMAVFSGGTGAFSGDFAYAVEIIWAVQHGATVLNNSLGGSANSPIIAAAVDYAVRQGASFVVSSGDNGDALFSSPADLPGVIAVTATTRGGNLADLAQIAPYVRFGAPGDNIATATAGSYSACSGPQCPLGTTPSTQYAYFGGTSSSAPYVAGVIGLMQGAYYDKFGSYMSPGVAEELLYSSGTQSPAGSQNYTSFKIPNASAAVAAVQALSAPPAEPHGSVAVTVLGGSGQAVPQSNVTLKNGSLTYSAETGLAAASQTPGGTAASFANIQPGTYSVLVGGPETFIDGDFYGTFNPADRLTASGTVTVAAGGSASLSVQLPKTTLGVQLTTSNTRLHLSIAEPGNATFSTKTDGNLKSGTITTTADGERYLLGSSYAPGYYVIGISTASLTATDSAYAQLTVTENGKTYNLNLGPFTKGEASPDASTQGGVANIVQIAPGVTALNLKH